MVNGVLKAYNVGREVVTSTIKVAHAKLGISYVSIAISFLKK